MTHPDFPTGYYNATTKILVVPQSLFQPRATHPGSIPPEDNEKPKVGLAARLRSQAIPVGIAVAFLAVADLCCDSVHTKDQQSCLNQYTLGQQPLGFLFSPIDNGYWGAQKKGSAVAPLRLVLLKKGGVRVEVDNLHSVVYPTVSTHPQGATPQTDALARALLDCTSELSPNAPKDIPTKITDSLVALANG